MRVDGEIDAEEYAQRKKVLVEEKQNLDQLITDNSYRIETWLDHAEKLFSFAETAKKRFESGNLVVKREILACLGSNLFKARQNKRLLRFYTLEMKYGVAYMTCSETVLLYTTLNHLQLNRC